MRGLRVFHRVAGYYRQHLSATVLGAASVVVSAIIALQGPGVVRRAIDALSAGAPLTTIWRYAAVLGIIAVGSGIFLFAQRQLLVGVSRHLEHRLRVDLYAHLMRLPASFYMNQRVGDLLTRATSDVGTVRMAVGPAMMYTINTVTVALLAIVYMIRIDLTLTLLALAVLPLAAA